MVSWDDGVRHYLVEVQGPTLEPLTAEVVLSDHLRSPNVSEEAAYVDGLIAAARRQAERITQRAVPVQTWQQVMDRFPSCEIVLPKPPLRSVTSITYVDSDGVMQTWGGSPLPYDVSTPSGPTAQRASIRPAYGTTFPATRSQVDAVTVTFEAGYEEGQVPADILHGMLLLIGEFYKQRSESVHAFNQNPALIRARDLFMGYRLF